MANEYDSNSLNQNHKREDVGYSGYSGMSGMTYNTSQNSGYNSSQAGGYNGSSNSDNYANGTNSNASSNSGAYSTSYGSNAYGTQNTYSSASSVYGKSSTTGSNSGKPKSQNPKPKKPKTKKNNMGATLGKTAAVAAVFGLVAGGAFQGVNYGVSKLRGEDTSLSDSYDADNSDIDDNSIFDNDNGILNGNKDSDSDDEMTVNDEATNDDAVAYQDTTSDDSVSTAKIAQQEQASSVSYDVANIVKKAQPSIVSITTKVTQSYQYFFQNYEQDATGAGSGIIIGQSDDVLYIATNYHVIEGAKEIKVGFNDGEIVDAEVKGYDDSADIAVVAVSLGDMKDSTKEAVTVANVGNSDALQVGEPAIAIGNALGYGQSVTVGYISALNRSIEDSDGSFIQTDAAINPGNSGGALINSSGQVIGINSVKYVDSTVEGMGFSIPINTAMAIINDIIAGKQEGNAYLGITGEAISREYAQIYGFPEGIYIKEVKTGSPAEAAGLHPGDIISKFGDKDIQANEDLQSALRGKNPGDTVEIVVYRADNMGYYEETNISVTLSAETP